MREHWTSLRPAEQIAQLQRHRLLPSVLPMCAADANLLQALTGAVAASWRQNSAADDSLLRRALAALAQAGCRALVLKGAALARWLYPSPEQRQSSDLDVLVEPGRWLQAHTALSAIGLTSDGYSQHDRASGQVSYHDPISGRTLDIHHVLSVVPELACRFIFDDLYAASIQLPGLDEARALSPLHAIQHAVIHYCAHQPSADRPAVWLYDLALLMRQLQADDWKALDTQVRARQIAALHAYVIDEVQQWFDLAVPPVIRESWEQQAHVECTSVWRQPAGSEIKRFLHSLACINTLAGKWYFLRARLFPTVGWMRGKYQLQGTRALLAAYARRWARGLTLASRSRMTAAIESETRLEQSPRTDRRQCPAVRAR